MIDVASPAVETPIPWRSMWFSPRITTRAMVDAPEPPSWVPVVALAALHEMIASIASTPRAFAMDVAVMAAILVAAQFVFGIVVGPFLLAFVGGWLGGEADPQDIRQAIAWSYVPVAASTVLWLPVLSLHGWAAAAADPPVVWTAVLLAAGMFTAWCWTFVLQIAALAEVQRFSIARALASMMILLIPVVLLGLLA